MRLAASLLAAAILPSLAAAQSEHRPVAVQQAAIGPSATTATRAPGDSTSPDAGGLASAARRAEIDCSALARSLAASAGTAGDTLAAGAARALREAAIIAGLCAHAQRQLASEPLADSGRSSPVATQAGEPRVALHGHDDPKPEGAAAPPQLRLHAFADVRYSAVDSAGGRSGFALGQFDFFARSQLSESFSVLSEMVVTAMPRNQFTTKLERLLLTYSPSDHFTAAVGRFHTGIGYYNAAYHHGTWFQTAVGRPLIAGIDGDIGLIPIHTLGITAGGEIPSGSLGLRYVAEVGSGRAGQSSAAIPPQPGLNDNNALSVNLGLIARPDGVDGLQVGASVYRDRLTMADTARAPMDETIGALHALYKSDLVELLGEAVVIRHSPRGGVPSTSVRGYYAQASRRVGPVRPYARIDYVDVPAANPLFSFLGRRSGPTLGVRYDFDALAAFKLQASHLNQTTRRSLNRVDAQVAFMF